MEAEDMNGARRIGIMALIGSLGSGCLVEHTPIDPEGGEDGTGTAPSCTGYRTYDGAETAVAYAAARLSDGGYVLGGYADGEGDGRHDYDGYVVRTDECGEPLWTRYVDTGGFDYVQGLAGTEDGGVVAVGYAVDYGPAATDIQALVVRFDAAGVERFRLLFGEPDTTAYAVLQSRAGVTVVAGGQRVYHSAGYGPAAYLAAVSPDGALLWEHCYGEEHLGPAEDLVETSDGGFALVSGGTYDPLELLATDGDGGLLWTAAPFGPGGGTPRIAALEGGVFFVSVNDGDGGCQVARFDARGALLGAELVDGAVLDLAPAPSGGVLLTGLTGLSGDTDLLTMRLDESGHELWRTTFDAGAGLDESAWAVLPTPSGGVTLAGEASTGGDAAEGPASRAFLLVGDARARIP